MTYRSEQTHLHFTSTAKVGSILIMLKSKRKRKQTELIWITWAT